MKFVSETQLKGVQGENEACEYLTKNGYKIIARNVTFGKRELDIVATKEQYIVFVEVKTRKAVQKSIDKFGRASAAVTHTKRENIRVAANMFLKKYASSVKGLIPRIDIIEVMLLPTDCNTDFIPLEINHIINV